MRTVRVWRWHIATLVVALSFAFSVAAQSSFVTGRVMNTSGQSLPAMVVTAYNLSGELVRSEITRSDGTYTLALAGATYKLLAYDPEGNFATSFYQNASSFATSAEVTIPVGTTIRGIDLQLEKGYRITGFVGAPEGASLSDVVVAAYNLNGTRRGFQKVSPTGSYGLVVPAGAYKLAAYDERVELATRFYSGAVSFENADTVTVSANRTANLILEYGGRLSGTISDREGRHPIEGALVVAYDLSGVIVGEGRTATTGHYTFVVPAGSYKVGASLDEESYPMSFLGDAATFEGAPSVSVSARQQLNGLSFTLAMAVPQPATTTLYISVVASNAGAGQTFFRSDVWIYNPNENLLEVVLTHLPPPGSGLLPASRVVAIPARGQRYLRDVVAQEFDRSGGGALRLEAEGRFAATSRTYNDPEDVNKGTSGLSIGAQPVASTLSKAVIPGLSNTASYRSNVGLFNPGPNPIEVTFRLYGGDGVRLAETSRVLEPAEWFQANTIFAFMGVASEVEDAYVTLSSSQGSFFSYGSVVDGRSGDATLLLPSPDEPDSESN